ncbi:MAG: GAF domain-containing protein [Syntrophobacteraceae bacterium]|nr:GAF domain-containing protein [Syntrophobacteraceae bacterium]
MPANDQGLRDALNDPHRSRIDPDEAFRIAPGAGFDTALLTRLLTALDDPAPLALLLERILATLSQNFSADIIVLVDPYGTGRLFPLAAVGLPGAMVHLPLSDDENCYTVATINSSAPILITEAANDPKVEPQLKQLGAQTAAWLPVGDSYTTRGALICVRCQPMPFTPVEEGYLSLVAHRIGIALEQAQRRSQLEHILQAVKKHDRHLDAVAIGSAAVTNLPDLVGADASAMVVKDREEGIPKCVSRFGMDQDYYEFATQLEQHIFERFRISKEAAYLTFNLQVEASKFSLGLPENTRVKTVLAIPLLSEGQLQGVLYALRFANIPFSPGSIKMALLYCSQVSAALEKASLYQAVSEELAVRKKAEERLWESEKRFRTYLRASSQVLYRMNADWSVALEITSPSSLVRPTAHNPNWLKEYIIEEDQPMVVAAVRKAMRQKCVFQLEHRARKTDGTIARVFSRAVPLLDSKGETIEWLGAALDITRRKQMEEALGKAKADMELRVEKRTAELQNINEKLRIANETLHRMPSKLIDAQEEERKRLSSKLHDSISQTLAALKYRIEHTLATFRNGSFDEGLSLTEKLPPVLQHAIDDTRTIYMGLRPKVLEDFGVVAALKWYRDELLHLYPERHIELAASIEEDQIPAELVTPIFRIAQEALNNVYKHSKAQWVDVFLSLNGGGIELIVSDDGKGMDLDHTLESSAARSLGLIGMKERAELTGGNLSIESAPDEGTTVRVQWPCNDIKKAE